MTLFEQWKDLIENQTEETFRDFWEEYSGAETKIYSDILDKPEEKMTGTLGELAAKYEVRPVIFMGFLDGINSLKKGNDFENFDENSSRVEIVRKLSSIICWLPRPIICTAFRSGWTSWETRSKS